MDRPCFSFRPVRFPQLHPKTNVCFESNASMFSEPDVRYSYTYLYPQISYNNPVKSLLEFEVMDLFSNAKAPYSR